MQATHLAIVLTLLLAASVAGHSGGQRHHGREEESSLAETLLRRTGERGGAGMGQSLRVILGDTASEPEAAAAAAADDEESAADTQRMRRMMHAYRRRSIRSCRASNLQAIRLIACELHDRVLEGLSTAERQAFRLALLATNAANQDEPAGHALGMHCLHLTSSHSKLYS